VVGCSFLTWRLTTMREHMRKQKDQLEQALEKIQQIATRDELTGVANRRFMLELMDEQIQRAARTGTAPMVALLDIDHFKGVNDTYGHHAGDCCLQTFATVVQSGIRNTDRLARWGGEEFLILLTDTDFGFALDCLERVRTQVAQAVVVVGGVDIRVTVSIGVTQYQAGDSIEKTIERADLALYAAKAQGRDRVVSA
ncbi:MAG: GGDEF domain-containing protein, partial [Ferruginibacter sp.]|nr:GGDEF domain-containing protein [Rhodoferax sp.]